MPANGNFSLSQYFKVDLSEGVLRAGDNTRVLVVDHEILRDLIELSISRNDLSLIRKLGHRIGRDIWSSLQSSGGASEEVFADEVLGRTSAFLAAFGWGTLSFEQWGDAVAVSIGSGPDFDEERLTAGAMLGGVFTALYGQEVACVPVSASDRYLILSPSVAERVWGWAQDNASVAEIVGRLAVGEAA